MPLQNRVTPTGEIIAHPARGLFMGNRGCLHDAGGKLVRRWQVNRWITCLTTFSNRKRPLMRPGHYTELFFLDEAVAAAAGHRPCAQCRRTAYDAFRAAWATALGPPGDAAAIDAILHAARDASRPPTWHPPGTLPDGAFVMWHDKPHLAAQGSLRPWQPDGYGAPLPQPDAPLRVLTPLPLLRAMQNGWQVVLHPSSYHDINSHPYPNDGTG